jgi:RNA polymerase primary sigma factor
LIDIEPGSPESIASQAVRDALEAVDDIFFRSGAALDASQLARIIDVQRLGAGDAALLRVQTRELGLFVDESKVDVDNAVTAVDLLGQGMPETDFASPTLFWRAAKRYPLLDAGQERALARRMRQGEAARERLREDTELSISTRAELMAQVQEEERAKNVFICCNLRLVASVTRPFRGQGLELSDLLQEGVIGLIRAVEKFDHTLGYKFSTYGTWWIRQAAQRAIADKGRTIRLPVHVHELVRRITVTERRLGWELEREPSVRDVADRLGLDAGHVAFVLEAAEGITSLDAAVRSGEEDGETLVDFIAGTEPSVEQQVIGDDRLERLQAAVAQLSEREAKVIRMRFGLGGMMPRTLNEIGQINDVTRERVRQIEDRAMKKLRGFIQPGLIDEPSTATSMADHDDDRLRRLECLTEDERDVMIRRFGIGRQSMSLEAVADDLERDRGWVLACQSSALSKLRSSKRAPA